jgi:hypothetical protein
VKTFIVKFYGRTIGAIGVDYLIQVVIDAEDCDGARLALYDLYEHIHIVTCEEVSK